MNDARALSVHHLSVLAAMLNLQNTTEVARLLGISQPAVSFALKKLRALLGDELFVRTAEGMRPTPRALALQAPVQTILETIDAFAGEEFEPRTTRRTFSIALSDIGELVFLPSLLRRLHQQAPAADMRCVAYSPTRLVAAMESGEVDLAIGYFPDLRGGVFYQQKLFEHPFVCLVRARHPDIHENLSIDQFLKAEHAVVSHEGRSQELFETAMRRARLQRNVRLRSPHFMSLPHIIAGSDLISIVPRAVGIAGTRLGLLRMLKPPIAIPKIQLKQFWHRRAHTDRSNVWIRRQVYALFRNNDPTADRSLPA